MKTKKTMIIFMGLILLLISCSSNSILVRMKRNIVGDWVGKTMQELTLEEKIGQLILMPLHASFMNEESEKWKKIQHDIEDNNVFGYHIWGGSNVLTIKHYTEKMQKLAKVPLIFTADYERGAGFIVDGATAFLPNMAFGAARDAKLAYDFGRYTAQESRGMGINQIFAPVVDVNSNPENPIINIRSFGEKPTLVAEMAGAYISGAQSVNVAASAKHFPGHGDTGSDSHLDIPVVLTDKERLKKIELLPFKNAINNEVYSIMSAHINVPAIENQTHVPATLSKTILTDLLRKKWGYEGLVYTDAMGMGGIVKHFTNEYAYVKAIEAGCDVIINSGNISSDKIVKWIKDAVERGDLSVGRINQSVERVLRLKQKLGLHKNRFAGTQDIDKLVAKEDMRSFAKSVAAKSITMPIDRKGLIPITQDQKNIVAISLYDRNIYYKQNTFNKNIQKRLPGAKTYLFGKNDSTEKFIPALNEITDSTLVIIGGFARYRAFQGNVFLPHQQGELINQIAQKTGNLIVISFGNPYILSQFPEISTYICAFGWESVQQEAAAKAITGEIAIQGKMPVSIPGLVKFGDGLERTPQKYIPEYTIKTEKSELLKTGFPHEVNVSPDTLVELGKMLVAGVEDSAYPGGVFFSVRDDIIFSTKAFGSLSYDSDSKKVNSNTIYDLASMTKVIATTSAAMKLYDQSLLKLDSAVSDVLPEFARKGKEKITFRHLLTHTSGLPAHSRLWQENNSPEKMLSAICEMELGYETATKSVYSCLGFIVLGKALEKLAGQPLDEYVRQEIFKPLNMEHTFYNPDTIYWENIAPTEYDSMRGGIVIGKVHDENAYYLGGVSGNAGLFSNVPDLTIFAKMMLNKGIYKGKRIFKAGTVELFTKPQNIVEESRRGLGWATPAGTTSAGHYFSTSSYGHTGFTGTSIWIDPEKNMFGILLTNRVHPTRKNHKLYDFRYKIYNKLQKAVTDLPLTKNPNVDDEF